MLCVTFLLVRTSTKSHGSPQKINTWARNYQTCLLPMVVVVAFYKYRSKFICFMKIKVKSRRMCHCWFGKAIWISSIKSSFFVPYLRKWASFASHVHPSRMSTLIMNIRGLIHVFLHWNNHKISNKWSMKASKWDIYNKLNISWITYASTPKKSRGWIMHW